MTLQHRSLAQTGSDSSTFNSPLSSYMQTVSAAQARVAMHGSLLTAVAWPSRPLQWLRFFDGVAM